MAAPRVLSKSAPEEPARSNEELLDDQPDVPIPLPPPRPPPLNDAAGAGSGFTALSPNNGLSGSGLPAQGDPPRSAEDFYEDALDQAMELYGSVDPAAPRQVIESATFQAAWASTCLECLRLAGSKKWEEAHESWHALLPEAQQHMDDLFVQPDGPGSGAHDSAPEAARASPSGSKGPPIVKKLPPKGCPISPPATALPMPHLRGAQPEQPAAPRTAIEKQNKINHWRRMIERIIMRRMWSEKGKALNYAKNGLPRNLDGKARGFGCHIGRWGWREVASQW